MYRLNSILLIKTAKQYLPMYSIWNNNYPCVGCTSNMWTHNCTTIEKIGIEIAIETTPEMYIFVYTVTHSVKHYFCFINLYWMKWMDWMDDNKIFFLSNRKSNIPKQNTRIVCVCNERTNQCVFVFINFSQRVWFSSMPLQSDDTLNDFRRSQLTHNKANIFSSFFLSTNHLFTSMLNDYCNTHCQNV